MRIFRQPRVITCDRPRCERRAVVACSNGPDRAAVCWAHVPHYERLWGQVFIRSMP